MTAVEKMQQKIDETLERQHQEELKGIAMAMGNEEKHIVLKTIPTNVLLDEVRIRCELLESREKAVKEIFQTQEE